MKCAFPGCPGEYEDRLITQKVDEHDGAAFIDNVPAKVCTLCGDTIIGADVLRMIEKIMSGELQPKE